jgi:hypothetical protein
MAFVDALISDCDADVVMADRRHQPGGHWHDAYPFVRLHGPSALYGVNSRNLGPDAIEQTGPNAGYYPRATAAEICDYYQRVLDEQLLASGRVRFFGMSEWVAASPGEHRLVSRLTGDSTTVRVRRRVVDARYLEPSIPATHVPSFDVEPGVRLIPVNDLVTLDRPASGFTVIGAGKTAIDACLWLLEAGVPADAIRWVRPREPVFGHGPGLDPGHPHRAASRDGVDGRPGRVRLAAAITAQCHRRGRRPPRRPADEVSARSPVRQHRARHSQTGHVHGRHAPRYVTLSRSAAA